ncbi:T9SS type A sorting domain-containing protein [Algoriphagus sediminis]|uniref:T9SS type A sorting domain-containing protein n=1 Tax=Algoriphagus sediminis TaxID=3057113 RepID=A0ABT7YEW7_9BACT|nr:T9SS type A sorting domain-containing protein [Algoriphagus sediminis]MDN3205059.1 T9SS type A sorting domain-containing protein [Algoriphagus sediminis]
MRIFLILFLILPLACLGQLSYRHSEGVSVRQNGDFLDSPFSGGINSAQIHTIDLNGDGAEEWLIWDINSRQLQAYAVNDNSFTYLPEVSYFLPADINGFLAVEDFDLDGKKDLFTSTALGIKAYRNTSSGDYPSFELASDVLRLDTGPNIQANNLDTPLLRDLDGDGDLDLVIFNFASGDYLEFYKNTSVERTGTPGLDGFEFPEFFWGNFVFCGCGDFSYGTTCNGIPLDPDLRTAPNARILHAGGHSILYEDYNGDGVSDLVLGRDECDILYFLPNKGTENQPIFDSFSNELPAFGALPQFPRYHVGESVGDDLIISLNTNQSSFNFQIDFKESVFRLSPNSSGAIPILQNDILDLGENSKPFFQGNKSSGNLWVTYNSVTETGTLSHLSSYSFSNNEFTLIESSEIEFLELQLVDAQYLEFIDQTGVNHSIASGIRYENNIPVSRIFEKSESGFQEINFEGYQPARGDYLQFFDYENQDYLLVAAQNGSLDLYKVDFSIYSAELIENDFLDFVDNPATRNLFVAVEAGESPNLFAVDQLGIVTRIENFMESERREIIQIETGNGSFQSRLGRQNAMTVLPALFSEAPDLILGSTGGGLIFLKSSEDIPPGDREFLLKVYPNPSSGPIKILSNREATGRLISAMGQVLLEGFSIPANLEFEIQAGFLPPGLYIIQLEVDNEFRTSRKIWIR